MKDKGKGGRWRGGGGEEGGGGEGERGESVTSVHISTGKMLGLSQVLMTNMQFLGHAIG